MIYETFATKIRPFIEADMNSFKYREAFYKPDVIEHNSHGLFPYTAEKKKAFLADMEEGRRIVWAIITDKGCVIGNVALQSINYINRTAELAIVTWNKDKREKGHATNATRLVLGHAFNKLGLNRVWTGTSSTNKAMQRVAEKSGFNHEGTFVEGMWLDGRFVDIEAYGVTADMWNWIKDHLADAEPGGASEVADNCAALSKAARKAGVAAHMFAIVTKCPLHCQACKDKGGF